MSTESRVVKVKLNIITIFNQVINFVNGINDECEECEDVVETTKKCEACPEYPSIPRELQVIDVKFEIIKQVMDNIAKRSSTLADAELIELCEQLGYNFTEEKTDGK